MKINKAVIKHIEKLGGEWKSTKDGAFWEVEENSFVLHAWPSQMVVPSEPCWITFDCAYGHKEFAKVANLIMGEPPHNFVSIGPFQKIAYIDQFEQVEEASLKLMLELLKELRSKDIDLIIREFRSNRPDRPSMPQINHLAALAWLKDVDTLLDYDRIFCAGGHLNFVPMIDKHMIGRALEIALT